MKPEELLVRLTRDQKIAMMGGADVWHTAGFDDPPVPSIRMSDGPAGVRGTSFVGPPSTSFPCGAALGATFDPDLVDEIGEALARECQARGVQVLLAPTVNLQRTPIGGRNFECYSEDPVLTAELAVAYIEGVQRLGVAACIKHFVANDTEYERMRISVEVDEATLREQYFLPFEAAVKRAGVRCVMAAYNRLQGTFCSEHRWLLTDVLRGEWGFDGLVMSDWFGCHSGAPSLRAGLDIEMPGPPAHRDAKLGDEIDAGTASDADLDRAVTAILELAEWTGAARPAPAEGSDAGATTSLLRRAAASAMVLLKNDRSALPLRDVTGRVALIGPNARDGRPQGGGSAHVTATRRPGPYDELVARGLDMTFEPGGYIGKTLPVLKADEGFRVDLHDHDGHSVTASGDALKWLWEQPPLDQSGTERFSGFDFGGRVTGTFTPADGGTWEIGLLSIGPSSLHLDGRQVLEVEPGQSGGVFFGLASQEVRTTIDLDAGRTYDIVLEYPPAPEQIFRGFAAGARHVPPGDPIERAVDAATGADVAVVIVGTDEHIETEGEDRTTMSLPGSQDDLVAAVAAANPNTVVVINAGSPVLMPWLDSVAAVLHTWFPGQELGAALADVLMGVSEPGGRLPITFPRSLDDTPSAPYYPGTDGESYPTMQYGERQLIGYRWYDRTGVEPLFPFGFGLGYTTFSVEPVAIAGDPAEGASVSVDVTNTGDRPGSEVVQVYVEPADVDPTRPVRTLAGFRRVPLDPGATARAEIAVPSRSFQAWIDGGWRPSADSFRLLVGRSSRDLTTAGTISTTDFGQI